jgi:ribonuclease D
MTIHQSRPFEFIDHSDRLIAAVRPMTESAYIALDTESNSRYHYPEQLCLIQIATPTRVFIIDTLAVADLSALKAVLEDQHILKIIHGADYDIRCLDRHHQLHIHNLFDTSVAARFAGITEFGLAALIKNLLGLTITKSERLQQSDWGRRPLSPEALEYAAGDVQHLFSLYSNLEKRLRDLGRAAWVAEENARLEEVRFSAPDIQSAYLGVKGGQDLDGGALAVLRSLYLFREEEAVRQGRPPFFVIPDFTLVALAANPGLDLTRVSGLGPSGLQRFGHGLRQALSEGQAAPPIRRPYQNHERLNPIQSNRLKQLKAWRTAQSVALALDPSLLWPAISLERLARAPATFAAETDSAAIRHWQRDQFSTSLSTFLHSLA